MITRETKRVDVGQFVANCLVCILDYKVIQMTKVNVINDIDFF